MKRPEITLQLLQSTIFPFLFIRVYSCLFWLIFAITSFPNTYFWQIWSKFIKANPRKTLLNEKIPSCLKAMKEKNAFTVKLRDYAKLSSYSIQLKLTSLVYFIISGQRIYQKTFLDSVNIYFSQSIVLPIFIFSQCFLQQILKMEKCWVTPLYLYRDSLILTFTKMFETSMF